MNGRDGGDDRDCSGEARVTAATPPGYLRLPASNKAAADIRGTRRNPGVTGGRNAELNHQENGMLKKRNA
jgi:hypothetical protein